MGIFEGIDNPLEQPLLITTGEQELSFIKKYSIKWHKNSHRSDYAEISNAGHLANMSNPEEFNKVLLTFLEKLNH